MMHRTAHLRRHPAGCADEGGPPQVLGCCRAILERVGRPRGGVLGRQRLPLEHLRQDRQVRRLQAQSNMSLQRRFDNPGDHLCAIKT